MHRIVIVVWFCLLMTTVRCPDVYFSFKFLYFIHLGRCSPPSLMWIKFLNLLPLHFSFSLENFSITLNFFLPVFFLLPACKEYVTFLCFGLMTFSLSIKLNDFCCLWGLQPPSFPLISSVCKLSPSTSTSFLSPNILKSSLCLIAILFCHVWVSSPYCQVTSSKLYSVSTYFHNILPSIAVRVLSENRSHSVTVTEFSVKKLYLGIKLKR